VQANLAERGLLSKTSALFSRLFKPDSIKVNDLLALHYQRISSLKNGMILLACLTQKQNSAL